MWACTKRTNNLPPGLAVIFNNDTNCGTSTPVDALKLQCPAVTSGQFCNTDMVKPIDDKMELLKGDGENGFVVVFIRCLGHACHDYGCHCNGC